MGEVDSAEVCMLLEGTYPYVPGGVSSWVHSLLKSLPQFRFALVHISPNPAADTESRYSMPGNVTALHQLYCHASADPLARKPPPRRRKVHGSRNQWPRLLQAIERIHLRAPVDDALIADLAANDLSVADFLHGPEAFDLIRDVLYPALAPNASFTEFFWHIRAMHVPLLRLLAAPIPEAGVYHSASCGYAGLVATVASVRSGKPLLITEHGLYAREREMELSRASWIQDLGVGDSAGGDIELSPLRAVWSNFFGTMSKIAYHHASELLTLSAVNQRKQLEDGAPLDKLTIIPNGVEPNSYAAIADKRSVSPATERAMRIGFVGRVVPIKDVITLIRAVSLARQQVDLELWIVGPEDETPDYAAKCHALVKQLKLEQTVTFLGRRDVREIYGDIDVMVLTSLSEGQPLVILEAYAAGLPVIATDVGACRELIEGRDRVDARLGASGIVTRVANPADTAAAMVALARDPARRREMAAAGLIRVRERYQQRDVIARYEQVYRGYIGSTNSKRKGSAS